jgi:ribonuclease J
MLASKWIPTFGHATISSMKELVEAIKPDTVVPIHSFHPEQFSQHFPNVKILDDGSAFSLD